MCEFSSIVVHHGELADYECFCKPLLCVASGWMRRSHLWPKRRVLKDRFKCARLGSTAGRRTTYRPCCDVLAEVRQLVECWVPSIRALGKQTGPDTIGRCGSSPGEVRNCIHQSITIRSLTEWPGTQVQAFEWLRKSSDPTLVTCPSPCEPVALCGLKLVLFASSQVR